MLDRKLLESLGGWQGYLVERVEWPEGAGRTLSIYLEPTAKVMRCEQCGARCRQVHETRCDGCEICRYLSTGLFFTCHAGACCVSNAVVRVWSDLLGWVVTNE